MVLLFVGYLFGRAEQATIVVIHLYNFIFFIFCLLQHWKTIPLSTTIEY